MDLQLAFAGVGLACLAHGAIDIISHVAYSLNGQRAEASIVGQRTVCVLEYQLSNESDLRRDPMSCEAAEAAAKANAGRQVTVIRDTIARLRFTLADGKVREEETKVSASNKLSPAMAAGSSVSIIYTVANPADLRIALNAARIAELMLLMGVGLLVLMFACSALANGSHGRRNSPSGAASPPRRERNGSRLGGRQVARSQ